MLRTLLVLSALAPLSSSRDRQSAPDRVLLIGVAAPAPIDLPGVTGALGLADLRVAAAGVGPTVSAALFELRHVARPPELPELFYQVLSRDPRTLALELSDVMRLPRGDEEATMALRTTPPHPPMDGYDISYPTVASITMTLNRDPLKDRWVRHLTFTDYLGDERSVPILFTRASGLTWSGRIGPTGLATLQSLADTGNRSHWDDMWLRNKGGATALDIASFTVMLHYDKTSSQERTGSYYKNIPIIAGTLNRTLDGGRDGIDLDDQALATRKRFGGITASMDPVLQLAAGDLGKSGSDGRDDHGANPKYRGTVENECSEFVSWYYYEAGLVIGGEEFRDIESTSRLDPAFERAGRLYDYHNGQRAWLLAGGSTRYTPQPGDMLARLYDRRYEHSMIVLGWNDATKVMTVVNGPWPVTLRDVPIQELEESGYDFHVGRIR